jgi:hypothetical protein
MRVDRSREIGLHCPSSLQDEFIGLCDQTLACLANFRGRFATNQGCFEPAWNKRSAPHPDPLPLLVGEGELADASGQNESLGSLGTIPKPPAWAGIEAHLWR